MLGAEGFAQAAIADPACPDVLVCCGASGAEVGGACCDGGLGWRAIGREGPGCL